MKRASFNLLACLSCLLLLFAGADSPCLALAGVGNGFPASPGSQGSSEDDEMLDLVEARQARRAAPRPTRPGPRFFNSAHAARRPQSYPYSPQAFDSAKLVGELARRNGVGAPLVC